MQNKMIIGSGGESAKVWRETVENLASGATATITCGFRPKHIAVVAHYATSNSYKGLAIWDEGNSTAFLNTNSSTSLNWRTLPGDGGITLTITDTGYSFPNGTTSATTYHTFAIG